MNYDEFAFFNQQLAAMVRDGIPLEGALRRLSSEMRRGPLQSELAKLGGDLANGVPLREAVQSRQLPDLYRQMLEVGAQASDLPAVLTLLADHYQRRQLIWTRLKGLMVYPAIVLAGAFGLSCFLSVALNATLHSASQNYWWAEPPRIIFGVWFPPIALGLAIVAGFIAATIPRVRSVLRWRLPGFKEASLAQVASALALMLKNGVPLDRALELTQQLERDTPAATELARWRQRLAGGRGKFSEMAADGRVFPPLFVWMVGQSGEDLSAGFQRAAEIYQSRSSYRADTLLYSALPCSILALGVVILSQVQPVLAALVAFMNQVGADTASGL